MPSKYVVRSYAEDSIYHIFNRGVERRNIFAMSNDYQIFLYYLKIYLLNPALLEVYFPKLPIRLKSKNLHSELELLAYCLMPNHFHLLLRQKTKNAIPKFMKQLTNAYCEYFNKANNRVGPLMQGKYKAVHIPTTEQLLHLSRYIHLNPVVSELVTKAEDYKWSSAQEYIKESPFNVCTTNLILEHFPRKDYLNFMSNHAEYAKQLNKIKGLLIEEPK